MTSQERLRRINENMDLFGPLPDDYEEFTENEVFKYDNIIIYSGKEKKAYCTGCNTEIESLNEFEIKPKHNKSTICPNCGSHSIAKSKGLIQNGFEVIKWSQIIDKSGEYVLIRYINHIRIYNHLGKYQQRKTEMLRTVIGPLGRKDFGFYYDGWAFWRKPYGYFNRSQIYEPRNEITLYNTDLKESIKDTCCKYSAVDIYIQNYIAHNKEDKNIKLIDPYVIEKYLGEYIQKPYLEQLAKLNLCSLIYYATSWNSSLVFISGKKRVHETLGLTRSEYLQLMSRNDPKGEDVLILRKLREAKVSVKNEAFNELCEAKEYSTSDFIIARKYVSEMKAIKWLNSNGREYSDYLDMADRLKWDMKNSMVLFPKDVKKAHDLAVEQFNKIKQKNIRLMLKKVIQSQIYDFEDNGLMIVVPKSGAQIVKEGQALHHCVASYVDSVAKGETMILFVRKVNEPGKPFYTLEWKNEKVNQCYGLNDCVMTEEIKKFVTNFEKQMIKQLMKSA